MAYEYEQLNERQQQRRLQQQRQLARQRAARKRKLVFAAVALVVVLMLLVLLIRSCGGSTPETTGPSLSATVPTPPTSAAPTQPPEPETVITLVAGGDLNVTDAVVASGETAGGYDYTHSFLDVAAVLARADVTLLNLEGNLVGGPYGSASASAPTQLAQALKNAGVDLVQTANSYSVHNGIAGLRTTMDSLRQLGMEPLGTFASQQEYKANQGFTICNIRGIRVAFIAFTKGVGSLGLPDGNEHCVNLLYKDYTTTYQKIDTDGIKAVLQAAQDQQPDVTVALLHWGSEYNNIISKSQEDIAKLMTENGVDVIIGNHSHYVQRVDHDAENGTLIAWGLGDFYGDAEKANTNYSILLQVEITRDNYTGKTRITGWDYVPIYTLTPERDGMSRQVVRLVDAINQYENNLVGCVTPKAYENMKTALARIQSRVGQ